MEKGYRRLVANHEATGYKAIRENEGKNIESADLAG
jgi:hypothetical protein